jgi:hypothetical protein
VTLAGVSNLGTFQVLLEPMNIPSSKNDVTQERHLLHPKLALAYLDIQSRALKLLRYQTEMFFMLFFALGVNQHTIDEHYDELVQILHKVLVHHILIVGWGFSQSKIHHRILVQTIPQNEGSLRKVTFLYIQLILSRSKIDLREHTCTTELIK